jgi:tetratricopeptide (TPR) repeat protein
MNMPVKNIKWFVLLILAIAGFFVYFNSFSNQLFWDDDDMITNNVYVHDLSYFPKYFSESLIAGAGQVDNYWRPLVLLSLAVDYHFFGLNSAGYHVVNLLWHLLAAWLAFLLIDRLTKRRWLAFLPALFFLIHPLQTEAVTYVSGRADPMSAVFILLSLLSYVLFRQENKKRYWLVLSGLAFIAALLSKEGSIMLPALIALIEFLFFFKKEDWRRSGIYLLPFVLVSIIYFLARLSFLNFNNLLAGFNYGAVYSTSLGVRLLTFTYVFIKYLSLLVAPFNLHMAYEITPLTSIFTWPVAVFTLIILLFGLAIKRYWQTDRLFVLGLAWFLILLLPRTNIISINRPLYEHFLYLPMLGFWLAFFIIGSKFLNRLRLKPNLKTGLTVFILLAAVIYFSSLSIRRNQDWHDPITFYQKNLQYTLDSSIQHNNLGMAYAAAGRLSEAIKEYQTAITIKDTYPQVHYNLGNALASTGQTAAAETEYYQAIKMSPEFSLPYNRLIWLAIQAKDPSKLALVLNQIKANFPEESYLTQAFYAYYYLGDYKSALTFGSRLLSQYHNNQVGLIMLNIK